MIDFAGQVVVITGAGRGLGRLYAKDIARRGGALVVNDLGCTISGDGADATVADDVVAEITGEGGIAVASHESVATPEGGEAIVRLALEKYGRIDAVISNAGIFRPSAFDELSPSEWRHMINFHLDGSFFLSQPAFKAMRAQGGGRFVFIASSAGLFGQSHAAHYAAAKSGVLGLANVIALEGRQYGILANTVLPFGTTRMATETVGEARAAEIPFLRAQEPRLVAPIVTYLASRRCELSHHVFSAGVGRFARVFVGRGEGWGAMGGDEPTAEDIEAQLGKVAGLEPFTVPLSILEEIETMCAQQGVPFDMHATI